MSTQAGHPTTARKEPKPRGPVPFVERIRALNPDKPLRTLWRSAGYSLRPPRPAPFTPTVDWRQRRAVASGAATARQLARVTVERRPGPVPTIVLGGFVPDAAESVFLQRGMFLRHGSVYCFSYAADGFSIEGVCAQLDDLVDELTMVEGTRPVVLGVSFGCGVILEWLRQSRRADWPVPVRGLVLVSPVTCAADILEPGESKPSTLLGRALRPFLDAGIAGPSEQHVERSRALLLRMFESGAQNKKAIRAVMTMTELIGVRDRVSGTLKAVTGPGAAERVAAFGAMEAPSSPFTAALTPLSEAPTLVLFAEKETSVLLPGSPTAAAFASGAQALFPSCEVRVVTNPRGAPVQHASLLFHAFNFNPPLATFYRRLRHHVRTSAPHTATRRVQQWLMRGLLRPAERGQAA